MNLVKLSETLLIRENLLTLEHILDNSKAGSGGERDENFLKYLADTHLLAIEETMLKRTTVGMPENYYLGKYPRIKYESDRHYFCRCVIQEEFAKIEINTHSDTVAGNMQILRANSSYDIVADDFSVVADIGLTPARNYFRCLTDTRVKMYLLSSYFDDYMDEILFSAFTRTCDEDFLKAVAEYETENNRLGIEH